MRKAVDFLISNAHPNGLITAFAEEGRSMYGHGFATLFLAQVYGMEEDANRQQRLHRVLTKAVELIARSQSTYGGWYYTPDSGSDEGSVTVTQLQALRVRSILDQRKRNRWTRRTKNFRKVEGDFWEQDAWWDKDTLPSPRKRAWSKESTRPRSPLSSGRDASPSIRTAAPSSKHRIVVTSCSSASTRSVVPNSMQ